MGAETTVPTEEVSEDPDAGGEVAEPGNTGVVFQPGININPDIVINPEASSNVGDMVSADPDDGGEVADGLFDDFESAVGTFQEQADGITSPFSDSFDSPGFLPESVADSLAAGEDLFGEGIAAGERVPGIQVPDLDPLIGDASSIADAAADGDVGGVVAGVQDAIGDYGGAIDEAVEVPFEQQIEDVTSDFEDEVSDFADDPAGAVGDLTDEFEGTVSGIADDIGL